MTEDFKIETPYLPGEKGCRITWLFTDDEEKTLYLRHEDLMEMIEILEHGTTAKIEMEDGASSILVNSDSTDFFLAGQKSQKIETLALKIALKEFIKNNPNAWNQVRDLYSKLREAFTLWIIIVTR